MSTKNVLENDEIDRNPIMRQESEEVKLDVKSQDDDHSRVGGGVDDGPSECRRRPRF
jgi:hypothetical protein